MAKLRPIVLIEDDERDADLTVRALRRISLRNPIVHFAEGEKALDFLFRKGQYRHRPPVNPCVILLDLKLPGLDGLDVLKAVRRDNTTNPIPVFVITASRFQKNVDEANKLQVTDYLLKPVQFIDFAGVAAKAGLEWGLLSRD